MRIFTMMPMRHWREAGPFAMAAEEAGFDALMTAELFLVVADRLARHGYGTLASYLRETGGTRSPFV